MSRLSAPQMRSDTKGDKPVNTSQTATDELHNGYSRGTTSPNEIRRALLVSKDRHVKQSTASVRAAQPDTNLL
ncbi:hypothetical protein AKAW_00479 [Aspergillus luchuensis IFO 4308]|nr:hypothetical protein AKAW_00479 [Aspergillus luchuensis IFO 4308]